MNILEISVIIMTISLVLFFIYLIISNQKFERKLLRERESFTNKIMRNLFELPFFNEKNEFDANHLKLIKKEINYD